nr:MAG TPA: hypothetical protein [Caudoviricetes sp.]
MSFCYLLLPCGIGSVSVGEVCPFAALVQCSHTLHRCILVILCSAVVQLCSCAVISVGEVCPFAARLRLDACNTALLRRLCETLLL